MAVLVECKFLHCSGTWEVEEVEPDKATDRAIEHLYKKHGIVRNYDDYMRIIEL